MEKISYKLENFEGPLDLLLHLISKNKLDIYDIQISELLEQYMEHIRLMQQENLDIQSEFLEMAARLVQIKTVSLLPKHEEADEMRQELTGQLLEYQECKRIAEMLGPMVTFDRIPRSPMVLEPDKNYNFHHTTYELFCAYLLAAGKGKRRIPPPPTVFQGIVARKIVSVGSRIIYLLRNLRKKEKITFHGLFEQSESRSQMVATFLAVLELVKAHRV